MRSASIVLISCVKSKLSRPSAAKDLYSSSLFRKERQYAERSGHPWFILSAEHGLVAPDEWLAPYERFLADTPARYRAAWGQWVVERLELLTGPLDGKTVEVHANSTYVGAIRGPLESRGAHLYEPLRGLAMGQRLSWYGSVAHESISGGADDLAHALRYIQTAVAPGEFLARGKAEVDRRGLYSWWVDEGGAEDLSRGLRLPLRPGMIYAGLAGATRWPSGQRSNNTLWLRISTMHLAGNHEFSTFRRTIGSILASANGSVTIDEVALTSWMNAHLRVITVAYDDGDSLGRIERAVLEDLDPPLNLQGMKSTDIRRRLKELRRAVVSPPGSATSGS